jgi:SAM-dependent methyltransferase
MTRIDACPNCGEPGRSPAELPGLVRCAACATVYAAEYVPHEEVFREGYLSGGTGDFGVDVSHPRFRAYLVRVGHERCRRISRRAPARSVLDVGCGSGEFLEAAVAEGWRAVGVEPLPDASQVARERGLDVRTGTTDDIDETFDAVTAFHVLEHMPDGPDFLRALARCAKPGGVVYVESPNWDSRLRALTGERWMHLRPGEHLVHNTPATLRLAMERAGLRDVRTGSVAYTDREHTLDELMILLARPAWRRPLARAGGAGLALGRAVARLDARRGRGDVVWGTGIR